MRSANNINIPKNPIAPGGITISNTSDKEFESNSKKINKINENKIINVAPIKATISISELKCSSNQSIKELNFLFIKYHPLNKLYH